MVSNVRVKGHLRNQYREIFWVGRVRIMGRVSIVKSPALDSNAVGVMQHAFGDTDTAAGVMWPFQSTPH